MRGRRALLALFGVLAALSLTVGMAGSASATTNLRERYKCGGAYLDANNIEHAHCVGYWAAGVNARDFATSADVTYSHNDGWHTTLLNSINSVNGRARLVSIYCRYADNHLSGLIQTISLGGGLRNDYYWSPRQEKCDGVDKGYYLVVKDTSSGLSSFIDINTYYSLPVYHYASQWYN